MQKVFSLVLVAAIMVPLAGCADHAALNDAIMENNRLTRIAYQDGMAGCGSDPACKVGVTAAYFSGAGQQPLFKPETAKDYLEVGLHYARIAREVFGDYWTGNGTSGDRASTFVKGDGNVFVSGNRMDYSSIGLDTSFSRTTDGGYNRTFTGLQPISDGGLQ